MNVKPDYRGEMAVTTRLKLGYTQKQMADLLGMTLNAWQKKEQEETRVSGAEYHLLLMLINEHPDYFVTRR